MPSPRYDAFEHLFRSLFASTGDLFVMLTVYLDDSGTSPSQEVAVVAGYLGSVHQWNRFNSRWASLLSKYGISKLHRANLESSQGEFLGWTPDRRTEFIKKACAIIRSCTYTAIGANVIKNDLKDILGAGDNKPWNAYVWCAHTCMIAVGHWCKHHNYHAPVQFVFEAGTRGHGQLHKLFEMLNREADFREICNIGGWSFQNKAVMPLQAADMAAYEFYKLIHGQIIEGGKRPIRKSMRRLFRQHELQYLKDWDRKLLEEWAREWAEKYKKGHLEPES